MTATMTDINTAKVLPTGELKIARVISPSCHRKPRLAALESDVVPAILVVCSVTLLALFRARQLYTVEPQARTRRSV
jgi:hypothetical protein